MKKISMSAFVFLLLACGKETETSLNLLLKLPATLSRTSGRYESFLKTVEFMKVSVSREGQTKEYRFPPQQWEKLQISDLPNPESKEKLEITIEVWDRKADGFRRTFPILKGQGSTKDQELRIVLTPQINL